MTRLRTTVLLVLVSTLSAASAHSLARTLTFEERFAAQKAIEEVYWRHRIWPKENPTPKPSLSSVMTDEAIRYRVEDYLKKSNALKNWWQRPITGEHLEAEMDRMTVNTRDAATLRDLFEALGNDPLLIAETLARQTLADRLIRNWYAFDDRLHGGVRRQAESAVSTTASIADMKAMGGEYTETTFVLSRDRRRASGTPPEDRSVELHPEEWEDWLRGLARQFGTTVDAIPVGQMSELQEAPDGFFVSAVLSSGDDGMRIASVAWPKRTFDSWWSAERMASSADVKVESGPFAFSAPASGGCVDDTWQNRYYEPGYRSHHTAVWTGIEMIVWGGRFSSSAGSESVLNTGGRYNPATDTWTRTSTGMNVPEARYDHTAVWTGSEMIVWGGSSLNTGGRYNPLMDTWATMSTGANVPAARTRHSAVWTGTEMIVWGGEDASLGSLNTGGRYNPLLDTWERTSTGTNVPEGRYEHTAVWTGTEMIVWGGRNELNYFNTGGRYSPSLDAWTRTSTGVDVPEYRKEHTAVWTGTEMIVWGGSCGAACSDPGEFLRTGGRYNPTTDTWRATSTGANVPTQRDGHTAVWTGTEMIVWGGFWNNGWVNTGGRYNPAGDSWEQTSTGENLPAERISHTAVWTGTEMIVWGGAAGVSQKPLKTGGRYNPLTDSWVPTSESANVPGGRSYHTAVWTGIEMIVWGGLNAVDYFNTGGRYDPSVDTWTPTSTGADVPQGRYEHTAVWTGTEMIVWGGRNEADCFNTGGRYNPSSDSWTPTSYTGADVPQRRKEHTAVWTGTEMIVWGGSWFGTPEFLRTGGRYNPTTDTWRATSTGANVPTWRDGHTAVWTGAEMIVWGGFWNSGWVNTGGRYKPSEDSWEQTSTGENVPAERTWHTAVWTGTEMIVWGGLLSEASSVSRTGGRYNPLTDSWVATSEGTSVPEGRYRHTAVWTGCEMIVWGGGNIANFLNTGGRYNTWTNSWTATTTAETRGRFGHTAVWTGDVMLVWGGIPDNAVGLYCAVSLPTTAYRDMDGDGFGDPAVSTTTCDGSIPPGYVANDSDCNDANASVHPGATEVCNGIDDDCDGVVDNGGNALCDDGNLCTDDACDGMLGCVHVNNTAPCNDGNACTQTDLCSAGVCIGANSVLCGPLDQCHDPGVCDPGTGICSNPNKPDGTLCTDNNLCTTGDACQAGVCTPTFNGLNEPNPRTNGYYKRLCHGPHSGDQLTDADAACVAQVTATFAGFSTVAQICEVIEPSHPNNDKCDQTEDDLMVLALNICRARVCTEQSIDSQCGSNGNVGQSLVESDAILDSPSRNFDTCSHAKCLDEEINTGRALEMNTLMLSLEAGNVRLTWQPPYLNDGTGRPKKYNVWRRVQGSLSPFVKIGDTTTPTFLDAESSSGAFEYEVTSVMN